MQCYKPTYTSATVLFTILHALWILGNMYIRWYIYTETYQDSLSILVSKLHNSTAGPPISFKHVHYLPELPWTWG